MTEAEERLYLEELLLESARWTRDPDEPYCSVELEIRDRLRKLNGVNTIDENGRCQSEPKPRPEHGHAGQVRVYDHGKSKWYPRELCEQVPCKNSKTGLKWQTKKEVSDDT